MFNKVKVTGLKGQSEVYAFIREPNTPSVWRIRCLAHRRANSFFTKTSQTYKNFPYLVYFTSGHFGIGQATMLLYVTACTMAAQRILQLISFSYQFHRSNPTNVDDTVHK